MISIQHPTPSTILYTVSTKRPTNTLPTRLLSLLLALTRILTTLLVLLVLAVTYTEQIPTPTTSPEALITLFAILPGRLATLIITHTPLPWRLPLCLAALWLVSRKGYTTESLLVIRGLGVQTSTSSSSYLWTSSTRFIPTTSVQDIFIHEAFKGFEVKFYLCIVVEREADLVVVFPVSTRLTWCGLWLCGMFADITMKSILPRRDVLEEVWRGARACLHEPKV